MPPVTALHAMPHLDQYACNAASYRSETSHYCMTYLDVKRARRAGTDPPDRDRPLAYTPRELLWSAPSDGEVLVLRR
jgi:hypothetical protein